MPTLAVLGGSALLLVSLVLSTPRFDPFCGIDRAAQKSVKLRDQRVRVSECRAFCCG